MEAAILKNWQIVVDTIIARRKKLSLTQSQLSELTGLSQATISRIESSAMSVELEHVLRVLNQLGLTIEIN
jgi:transcriptional regulator with XRE-family HTH domain